MSDKKPHIKDFIGHRVSYDGYGTYIWGERVNKDGEIELQMLADVRGWGAIQNLFKTGEEACAFQDSIGEFIAEAINEKLEREKGIDIS